MRTTLTLDDDIAARLKEEAHHRGEPLKAVVNETLRAGLTVLDAPPKAKRYRLKPASLGEVLPGLNLDKALRLADSLEDEGIAAKLELRK
jgi:hypothetical protein